MLNKVKKKYFSKFNNKKLLSNFISLSILQGANFLLPLLSVPYLVRVIGVEKYGLLSFATSMIMYFLILSDYGFNMTATKEISIHRDSREKIIEIFSAVISIKVILALIGLLILFLLISVFPIFQEYWYIYILTYGMVIGQVLFPTWFFQGMEEMKYISILNILAKSIFLIMIFIFVNNEKDYYLVPIFNSLGFIISGAISLYYVKKKFFVSFQLQPFSKLKYYIIDGWHIFISRIAVVSYTSSNIFILGLFTNNTIVGYYSIASKVISVIAAFGLIINQVLFPHLSKIWKQSKCLYYKKFIFIFKILLITMSIMALILFVFSFNIINLLSGKYIIESIIALQYLAITVMLFPLGGLFTQSFVTQGKNIFVTKATFYTTFINLILVFMLVYLYGIYGLVTTVILVQIFQVYINSKYFLLLKKENKCAE